MKRYLVVLVIVLVAGAWVAGFAPEYSARHDAEADRDRLQERVEAAESRLRIGELLGQSLALGDLAREERFGEAQPLSSAFFDAVRAEAQRAADPAFREALEAVLESRDPITAALSRGEPEAAAQIADAQRRLRRCLGYTVPGGVSPAESPRPEAPAPGAQEPAAAEPPATDSRGQEASPSPTPTPTDP